MIKHKICLEAQSISHFTDRELKLKIQGQLKKLDIILSISKLEVERQGRIYTRKELP